MPADVFNYLCCVWCLLECRSPVARSRSSASTASSRWVSGATDTQIKAAGRRRNPTPIEHYAFFMRSGSLTAIMVLCSRPDGSSFPACQVIYLPSSSPVRPLCFTSLCDGFTSSFPHRQILMVSVCYVPFNCFSVLESLAPFITWLALFPSCWMDYPVALQLTHGTDFHKFIISVPNA